MKKSIIIIIGILVASATAYCQNSAIQVSKQGKGAAIILLPGFTCPASVWDETISHIDGKYQYHFVNYAGFNGIPPIQMPWYATIKKEMIEYIRKEKLKNITIIGHSMGGTLALDLAAELPEIKKIIAVDALPCMRDLMMPNVPAESLKYESPYNDNMLKQSKEEVTKNATMMAGFMTNTKSKIDTLVNWSVIADRKTYVYGYTDLLKLDLRDALANVKAETLVLAASFPDVNAVNATLNKQYAKLPVKTILVAPDSRHFVMWDQAEWFYANVNTFLKK